MRQSASKYAALALLVAVGMGRGRSGIRRRRNRGAGLKDVTVETVEEATEFETGKDPWE